MLILNGSELLGLLSPLQIIGSVEEGLRAREESSAIVPKRQHIEWSGNSWLSMPAVSATSCGVKFVSVVPGNAKRGLAVTNGAMILHDAETGIPLTLMNAAALTAQRTGAVGALGVKHLTPECTDSVGIIGCGVQGAWQAIFACAVRPIREVFAVSRSPSRLEQFATTISRHVPRAEVVSCTDVRELLDRTTLIVTATTASEPVLPDEPRLLENKHFISVGSYKPTMQELPDSVYKLAGKLVVDSEHARHEVGDVINPVRNGILSPADVFSIAECVTGERVVSPDRTTAYKSVGSAIYDLLVAQALYRAAKAKGCGREITL